jgi:hypothetical protein
VPADILSINDEDLQGLMEVTHGLAGPNLDFIIHSPGGSPEATEALVLYLRSRFDHIRVIVPSLAMSAATMFACSANEIVMGKHSFLGPIDPQLFLNTKLGERMVPAQAICEQFERAKQDSTDLDTFRAWVPMLEQYGPDLLVTCDHASDMARSLVVGGLSNYMFAGETDGARKAEEIAEWLSDHREFLSHGRHIPRWKAESKGLRITHLEDDEVAQDYFLSIFHAATHTFNLTNTVKIIENHLGKAFIRSVQRQQVMIPQQIGQPIFVPAQPPGQPPIPGPIQPPDQMPTPVPVQPPVQQEGQTPSQEE